MTYSSIIEKFIKTRGIRDLCDKPPLSEINLSQPIEDLPYVVATIIKTTRSNKRKLNYEPFLLELGLAEGDIAAAYRKFYGNWHPFRQYFPHSTIAYTDLNRFVPLEIEVATAWKLGGRGLLRGKTIDGKFFADKEQWYVSIPNAIREHELPEWYILYKIQEEVIRTKVDNDTLFANFADVETSKQEFMIDRWMRISDATGLYRSSRQRILELVGKGRIRVIQTGKRTVYVSGKDVEDTMTDLPRNTSFVSDVRAEKILDVNQSTLDIYLKAGMFDEVRVGGRVLLRLKSVMKLKNALKGS